MSRSDRPIDKHPAEPGHDGEPGSEADAGRPSGPTDADGLRPGVPQAGAPTEAPEERGGTPATEHGPGGDL